MAKGGLNGKAVVKALGKVGVMTLTEASQAAREIFRDLGAGIDPRKTKSRSTTFTEALTAYLDGNDLAPRTRASYAETVKFCFEAWADLPLGRLTREMVEARHRAISNEVEQRRPGRPSSTPRFTWPVPSVLRSSGPRPQPSTGRPRLRGARGGLRQGHGQRCDEGAQGSLQLRA